VEDFSKAIEQSIADKIRSYGIDNVDMPKPTRIAVAERMNAFYRDVLSASDEGLDERMRDVATHALQLPHVLETGDLRVRRDDADELSAIRAGAMSFDELLSAATALQESMEAASTTTRLPADVERQGVDDLLLAMLQESSP
jgi:hypothetical protein